MLSKEQTAEMRYLRWVLDVTLRDKKHRAEIRKARDVNSLLRIGRSHLHWFGHVSRISQERLAKRVLLATPTGRVVHGTYLSVPFQSHPIETYACPIPRAVSHGIPTRITLPWTSLPPGKWPRSRPRTRWPDYISDLTWSRRGVDPRKLTLLLIVTHISSS